MGSPIFQGERTHFSVTPSSPNGDIQRSSLPGHPRIPARSASEWIPGRSLLTHSLPHLRFGLVLFVRTRRLDVVQHHMLAARDAVRHTA